MTPGRRSSPTGWLRRAMVLLSVVLLLAACGLELLDRDASLQLRSRLLTVAASFIGVLPLVAGLGCLLLLVALPRWWRLVAAALTLLLLGRGVIDVTHRQAPPVVQPNFVVLAQNTYYGWADPVALAHEASVADADVVVLPEVTARTLTGLAKTDWNSRYRYHAGSPVGDWNDAGLMVFSRYPLRVTETGPHSGVALRLQVARPQAPLTLIGVHFANPMDAWSAWTADFAWLREALRQPTAGPVVVAGDLNAVPQHEQFRALLATQGLRDAAAETGQLWSPTFPSSRSYPPPARWALPIMQIDHVLVGSGVTTAGLTTFRIDGTDHRGVVARLRVG